MSGKTLFSFTFLSGLMEVCYEITEDFNLSFSLCCFLLHALAALPTARAAWWCHLRRFRSSGRWRWPPPSFASPLLFPASCSTLWLRCLRHGLRGGVTCAAFAAWADGDGRPSFTSTIRFVLPYSSADCAASVRRPGNTKYEGSTIGVCNAVVDLRAVMRWWFVGSRVLIRSVIVSG